jgi:hypothetical protein
MSQEPRQDTTDIEDRCKVCHKPRGRCEYARDFERDFGGSQVRLKNTVAAAEAGCKFCRMLVSVVARARGQDYIQCTPDDKTSFSFSFIDYNLKVEVIQTADETRSRRFEIYTTGLFAYVLASVGLLILGS